MSDLDANEYILSGVVATTGALTGRSYRLGRKVLDNLRDDLLSGKVSTGLDHNSSETLNIRLLSAETYEVDSGEYVLAASWAVPAKERERIGNRTAISVQLVDEELDGWQNPISSEVRIYPDCYHWTDQEIVDSLERARSEGVAVAGGRLIQLAGEPPVKVVFDFLNSPQGAAALWAAVFAALTELMKKFRAGSEEQRKDGTKFSFVVHRKSRKIVIESSDAEQVGKMVEKIMGAVEILTLPEENSGLSGKESEQGGEIE